LRALVGITLFYSAYMAEEIRSGLHSLPHGQFEAAHSLGFGYCSSMSLIIIPQVLQKTIPHIVNIFIHLFKDTTLILIIGLFDFLGMIQAANEDPKWLAYDLEGYLFAALGYWLFCYLMSRYSEHLHRKIRVGQKS
ncbi:MAG TPA: ABC transporter permease subunit, partial [Gammaproteobacteria bacterium]|nr:ABC transporter permease subunit [Gammaproteobacteria bacterium]